MVKRTRYSSLARAQLLELLTKLVYLPDAEHVNHQGKEIGFVAFYNAKGESLLEFLEHVLARFVAYEEGREGKQGNKTQKLFEEFIFSSPEYAWLRDEEIKFIVERILREFFADVAVAVGVHVDPVLGRTDIHFVPAAYTNGKEARVFTTAGYGHGKAHIIAKLETIETGILAELNARRPPEQRMVSARERHEALMKKKGIKHLGRRLAKLWDGRKKTLRRALLKLGYARVKVRDKTVKVARRAWSKAKTYMIASLERERQLELEEIAKAAGAPPVSTAGRTESPITPEQTQLVVEEIVSAGKCDGGLPCSTPLPVFGSAQSRQEREADAQSKVIPAAVVASSEVGRAVSEPPPSSKKNTRKKKEMDGPSF